MLNLVDYIYLTPGLQNCTDYVRHLMFADRLLMYDLNIWSIFHEMLLFSFLIFTSSYHACLFIYIFFILHVAIPIHPSFIFLHLTFPGETGSCVAF